MPNVKERAEDLATTMDEQQQAAIRMLANQLHRLNAAVGGGRGIPAFSIELQRVLAPSPPGWLTGGDLLTPIIVKQK